MNYMDLNKAIKSNNIKNVYLIYGEEEYIIDKMLDKMKERYIDKNLEAMNYVELKGKDLEFKDILNACETLPFMSEKKMVVLKDSLIFKGNNSIDNKTRNMKDKLKDYIKDIKEDTIFLIVEKNESIRKNNPIYKNINNLGSVVEINRLNNFELEKWISKKMKSYDKHISNKELKLFIDKSAYLNKNEEKTLYDLENEIKKIVNYIGSSKEVDIDSIESMMKDPLETNIFKLLDYIGNRDSKNALRIFNEMYLGGEAPLFILHMIVRQFRNLLYIKSLNNKGYDDSMCMKKVGLSFYEYKKLSNQVRVFKSEDLKYYFKSCLEADKNIKLGIYTDRLALESLIVKLCK